MAHTTHPDTRGDLSWRSLTEQLGFHSVSDLCSFLDLPPAADERATVPVDLENAARIGVEIARVFFEAIEL